MSKEELVFQIIQSIGIISSLLFTSYTLIITRKQTKATNSLLITQHHREIWTTIYQTEDLKRVFDETADIIACPVTEKERAFTNMIFLHMSSCLKLTTTKACFPIEGMKEDIRDILSYPIPRYVWADVCKFHDKDFVKFVITSCF